MLKNKGNILKYYKIVTKKITFINLERWKCRAILKFS